MAGAQPACSYLRASGGEHRAAVQQFYYIKAVERPEPNVRASVRTRFHTLITTCEPRWPLLFDHSHSAITMQFESVRSSRPLSDCTV